MTQPGNEGAPPADPDRRHRGGGFPWGRIVAALIALLLLVLLIPLACQALRGSGTGDEASQGASQDAGETMGSEGAAGEQAAQEEETGGAGGGTGGGENAQGGDTTGSGGEGGPSRDGGGGTQAASAGISGLEDQSGDGQTVAVPQATISGVDGWLAVHEDAGGEPGPVLGHAPLQEGENTDIEVALDEPVDSSQTLYVMLHAEDPADGEYTFPDGDPPVEEGGEVVVEPLRYAISGTREAGDGGEAPLPKSGGPNAPALAAVAALLSAAMPLAGALLLLVRRFRSTRET